eukprot:162008-Chlamydomonas_euryale.AAC.3
MNSRAKRRGTREWRSKAPRRPSTAEQSDASGKHDWRSKASTALLDIQGGMGVKRGAGVRPDEGWEARSGAGGQIRGGRPDQRREARSGAGGQIRGGREEMLGGQGFGRAAD